MLGLWHEQIWNLFTIYGCCDARFNHLPCPGSQCCLMETPTVLTAVCTQTHHTSAGPYHASCSGYSLSRWIGFLLSAVKDHLNQSYTLLQSSFPPRPGLSIPLLRTCGTSVHGLEILVWLLRCLSLDHSNLEKVTASLSQTAASK